TLIDLNEHLIQHPKDTYFVRVQGDSMLNAGIHDGDMLVVDRAINPKDGHIVVAVLNGEFTVKRIQLHHKGLALLPENPSYAPIDVTTDMQFEVWGVVTSVIHALA
ncbi:MAG: translesion error-prone DNA polymerase V autoproteolytic subunit, partial [Rickettsiales bacterium]|nr:translesion error-prone DNA polymerase V autoproteolytic subunit [Rickettsiales bacterium]